MSTVCSYLCINFFLKKWIFSTWARLDKDEEVLSTWSGRIVLCARAECCMALHQAVPARHVMQFLRREGRKEGRKKQLYRIEVGREAILSVTPQRESIRCLPWSWLIVASIYLKSPTFFFFFFWPEEVCSLALCSYPIERRRFWPPLQRKTFPHHQHQGLGFQFWCDACSEDLLQDTLQAWTYCMERASFRPGKSWLLINLDFFFSWARLFGP